MDFNTCSFNNHPFVILGNLPFGRVALNVPSAIYKTPTNKYKEDAILEDAQCLTDASISSTSSLFLPLVLETMHPFHVTRFSIFFATIQLCIVFLFCKNLYVG